MSGAYSPWGQRNVPAASSADPLPEAVCLILRLVATHERVSEAEAIARAICAYAEKLGLPTLAAASESLQPRAPP